LVHNLSFDETPLNKPRPNAETLVQLTAQNVYFTKSHNMGVLSRRKSTYEYIAFTGSCMKYGKLNCRGDKTDSVFPAYTGFLCDNAPTTPAVLR
jgi:hypothetical protein